MRYLKAGDTIKLNLSFFNKAGTAVNLSGYTVSAIISKRYSQAEADEIHKESKNALSASVDLVITDEDSASLTLGFYDFYLSVSGGGEYYTCESEDLIVGEKATRLDFKKLELNDNLFCKVDDDVTLSPISSYATDSITLEDISFNEGIFNAQKIAKIVANGSPAPTITVGGADASFFTVSGTKLLFTGTADYENKPTYSIEITATNSSGSFTKGFIVSLSDIQNDEIGASDSVPYSVPLIVI